MHKQARRWILISLIFGLVMGLGVLLLPTAWNGVDSANAQAATAAVDINSLPFAEGGPPKTFLDYWSQGGGTMWALLATAIWPTAVLVELLVKLRLSYFCPPDLVKQLTQALVIKDFAKAWKIGMETPCALSQIFCPAVAKLPMGKEVVEATAAEGATDVNNTFKIKNSYISLNATIAPLLGLFGTIAGMVGAFNKMAFGGAVGDPTKLAGDIGTALITTYGGLVVAIPGLVIYYIMGNRLRQVFAETQKVVTELFDEIKFSEIQPDMVVVTREMKDQVAASLAKKGKGAGAAKPAAGAKAATGKTSPKAVAPKAADSKALETAECPNCKAAVVVGSKKCAKCGSEMEWE